MKLYVEEQDMPQNCAECKAEGHYENSYGDEYGFFCPFGYKAYTSGTRDTKRLDNCPLVPVPPHGRLIDADAMLTEESEAYMTAQLSLMGAGGSADATRMINEVVHKKLQMLISDTPTIIEGDNMRCNPCNPTQPECGKCEYAEDDKETWLCLSCRHYPPSSTDGKPCSQCNPSEVWHSCYDPAEEGE